MYLLRITPSRNLMQASKSWGQLWRLRWLCFAVLDPTNNTGMSKQTRFQKKAYKASEKECFKPRSSKSLSHHSGMLSQITAHALALMRVFIWSQPTHIFSIFSSKQSLILMFVQLISLGTKRWCAMKNFLLGLKANTQQFLWVFYIWIRFEARVCPTFFLPIQISTLLGMML